MKNGDQPINPTERLISGGGTLQTFGLTKREYFAALAMQGIMSSNECGIEWAKKAALDSVIMADALLAELEETKDQ
jgi:hypothetical protein